MKTFLVLVVLASTMLSACTNDNNDDVNRCLQPTPPMVIVNPNEVVE